MILFNSITKNIINNSIHIIEVEKNYKKSILARSIIQDLLSNRVQLYYKLSTLLTCNGNNKTYTNKLSKRSRISLDEKTPNVILLLF